MKASRGELFEGTVAPKLPFKLKVFQGQSLKVENSCFQDPIDSNFDVSNDEDEDFVDEVAEMFLVLEGGRA